MLIIYESNVCYCIDYFCLRCFQKHILAVIWDRLWPGSHVFPASKHPSTTSDSVAHVLLFWFWFAPLKNTPWKQTLHWEFPDWYRFHLFANARLIQFIKGTKILSYLIFLPAKWKQKKAEYYKMHRARCTHYENGNQPLRAVHKLDTVQFLFWLLIHNSM